MTAYAKYISITIAALLFISCGLSDGNTIRMTIDSEEISESGVKISLSHGDSGAYYVYLTSRYDKIVLAWDVRDKNPAKWVGKRFRAHRFRVKETPISINFDGSDVGILIEITDVSGKVVSGRFSGGVGVGAGSHRISNGTFRAPVYFWDR